MNSRLRQRAMVGCVAAPQLDLRQEVGRVGRAVERALGLRPGRAARSARGHVRRLHVAEAGGDVDDAVVGVAEVVDRRSARSSGTRGTGSVSMRQDHDVLVPHVVVLDVGPHRQRRGVLAAVEEDAVPGHLQQRRLALVQLVDELAQRPLVPLALAR